MLVLLCLVSLVVFVAEFFCCYVGWAWVVGLFGCDCLVVTIVAIVGLDLLVWFALWFCFVVLRVGCV